MKPMTNEKNSLKEGIKKSSWNQENEQEILFGISISCRLAFSFWANLKLNDFISLL
jgi:hypothetical protein